MELIGLIWTVRHGVLGRGDAKAGAPQQNLVVHLPVGSDSQIAAFAGGTAALFVFRLSVQIMRETRLNACQSLSSSHGFISQKSF